MPRLGFGLPLVSSVQESPITLVEDLLWEDIDANGSISVNYQETRTNILLHSQDATDAEAWSKTNTTVDSTLYEAPNDTNTANAIKSNSTGEKAYNITQTSLSVTAGKTYTLSVHLKKENLGFARIYFSDGASKTADFNLTTGVATQSSNVIRTQVDEIDGGWFRCSMTFIATSTVSSAQVRFHAQSASGDNTPNVAVSGIVLIYVWGFQLEENSEPSAYIKTTTAARTVTEVLNDFSNVWDFDNADLMPEADPDSEGAWETLDNLVLNGDYEELGSELVTNGNFATDSDWTKETGWSISNNKANFNTTGNSTIQQNLSVTTGKTYRIQITGQITSGQLKLAAGSGLSDDSIFTLPLDTYYTHDGGTNDIQIRTVGASQGYLDNVSVKQVDPNDRWTLGTGWSIEDGKLIATSTDAEATQSSVVTPGNTYEVTFTVDSISSGEVRVKAGTTFGTSRNSAGTYTQIFNVLFGGNIAIDMVSSGSCVIDNVIVREYAVQPKDI